MMLLFRDARRCEHELPRHQQTRSVQLATSIKPSIFPGSLVVQVHLFSDASWQYKESEADMRKAPFEDAAAEWRSCRKEAGIGLLD